METVDNLEGGKYSLLTNATFLHVRVEKENQDGTVHQLLLPEMRQASVWRKDLYSIAERMGDVPGRSCWL